MVWKSLFGKTRLIKPGNVSPSVPLKTMPKSIRLPPYVVSGNPSSVLEAALLRSQKEIKGLKTACHVAKKVLDSVEPIIKPGVTTEAIDIQVHKMCMVENVYPSPLYYRNFPKSVCTSVNNVACHGIPDDRPLEEGDLINVDVTVYTAEGYHGDLSRTFIVGDPIDQLSQDLNQIAKESLHNAIDICHPGRPVKDLGDIIYSTVTDAGFGIVPQFTGHGIGTYFHGPPDIYHFPQEYDLTVMKPGLAFTIEPVVAEGGNADIRILKDNWTAVTTNDARTAQWEHTVIITDEGVEVLTA